MHEKLIDKVTRWSQDGSVEPIFDYIDKYLVFREKNSYYEFHPTIGPFAKYFDRLVAWLENVEEDEHQKQLFRFAPSIFFLGSKEFISLYRNALNENIIQWLIETEDIGLGMSDLETGLHKALSKTWFCGVTDSMHISDFHHVNNLEGKVWRPDWHSLSRLGDPNKIACTMVKEGLNKLVLLEDFVGSGSQLLGADGTGACKDGVIGFAAQIPCDIQVLVCPLVICPTGVENISRAVSRYKNVQFSPVLELAPELFLRESPMTNEPQLFQDIRELIKRNKDRINSKIPFGFSGTGSLTIMYTNCPDNTLPFLHASSKGNNWKPLFPRSSRVLI